ncbi:MAG TPA: sulfotransferase [Solirubrobacteraceae bacterium]|nr:sulfotransferase [Solirubrobacteraceae bacterium]
MRALRDEPPIARAEGGGVDVPPLPPPCPPGWRTGPPDFIGVGVQRCGTTRWFDLIGAHPEVLRPAGAKELHYFDRFYAGGCTTADLERYHEYFPRDDGHTSGEWTPLYMCAPWVPPLLAAAAPDARLLVLLRDPVERYLSGLQLGISRAAKRNAPLSRYAPFEQLARGFYHAQLTHLLRYFDRSQVLVLQYERCTREPLAELRRTFEFLGLSDAQFVPELDAHPELQPRKPMLDESARRAYADAYHEDVARLIHEFPDIDVSLWPNFTDLSD